jgi:hypothetical protein
LANVLVKPVSDSTGNLVILADNVRGISLVDLTTGEIIEQGRNAGRSNGRDATVRFSRPGSAYQNVGVMDDRGNVLISLRSAGERVQFNYEDYNKLIAVPPSTIEGYRWDNSKNVQAQQTGQVSNAEIANMSSEEYDQYLQGQLGGSSGSASKPSGISGLASAALPAAGLLAVDALASSPVNEALPVPEIISATRVPGSGAAALSTGALQGPTAAAVAPVAGAALGAALLGKGAKDLTSGDSGDPISRAQLGFTTGGLSEVARLAGIFGGKSTKDYQNERVGNLESQGNVGAANFLREARGIADKNNDTWQEGPFKGQKWSFDKATQLAKQDPTAFIGVLGNFEAFGDKWLGVAPEKQKQVVSQLLNEGLYTSDKGDVLIKDKNRANEIFSQVSQSPSSSFTAPTSPVVQPSTSPSPSGIVLKNGLSQAPAALPPSDAEPAITNFTLGGGPEGGMVADQKKMLALSLLGNSPYSQFTGQLLSEAFRSPDSQRKADLGFAQIGAALGNR